MDMFRALGQDEIQSPPLWKAVRERNIPEILQLIEEGHDVSVRNHNDRSLLYPMLSWDIKSPEFNLAFQTVTRAILEKDVEIFSFKENIFFENTVLHLAIANENHPASKILLETAISVAKEKAVPLNLNIEDWEKKTPLHLAVVVGMKGIVSTLIQHGAEVNHQDKDGQTPLHRACLLGKIDTIEELMLNGANPKIKDSNGRDAFFYFSHMSKPDIGTMLRKMSIDPHRGVTATKNYHGRKDGEQSILDHILETKQNILTLTHAHPNSLFQTPTQSNPSGGISNRDLEEEKQLWQAKIHSLLDSAHELNEKVQTTLNNPLVSSLKRTEIMTDYENWSKEIKELREKGVEKEHLSDLLFARKALKPSIRTIQTIHDLANETNSSPSSTRDNREI
jgi:hypothetical protein